MFRISFSGTNIAEKKAREKVERAIRDPRFLNTVGEKVLANIKQDLRAGKDPNSRKTHENKLKPSTIKSRKYIAQKNGSVSEHYMPNKPLILTGQLVRSIAFKIKGGRPILEFIARGMHKVYKGTKGKPVSNQKLLEIHHFGQGQSVRRMIGMSKQGAKSIASQARKAISRLL